MANRIAQRVIDLCSEDPSAVLIERTTDRACWTRADILDEAGRLASCLDKETPAEATIAIESRPDNGADFIACLLATWGSGRRALPIASSLPEEEVELLLSAHRPHTFLGRNTSGRASIPCSFGESGSRAELDRGSRASLLLQSSGTVGRARVALREAEALDNVGMTLLRTICVDTNDCVLSALPMHHAYGIEHAVLLPVMAGARIIQMPTFQIDVALEWLANDVSVLPTIPVTIEALGAIKPERNSLRLAYTAGSPLPSATRDRFQENWGIKVGDLYGASEVGTITWGYNGRATPVPGVEIKLAADGELMVRSNAMFVGYLDATDQSPAVDRISEGWFLTGDLASIGPENEVRLIGRARLQFDVGGLKVNPTQVEGVLSEHEGIAEVLVGPLKLSETVNRVHALVVASPNSANDRTQLLASITDFARQHLPPHQVPRQVDLVESLPRTTSGKLIRSQATQ